MFVRCRCISGQESSKLRNQRGTLSLVFFARSHREKLLHRDLSQIPHTFHSFHFNYILSLTISFTGTYQHFSPSLFSLHRLSSVKPSTVVLSGRLSQLSSRFRSNENRAIAAIRSSSQLFTDFNFLTFQLYSSTIFCYRILASDSNEPIGNKVAGENLEI